MKNALIAAVSAQKVQKEYSLDNDQFLQNDPFGTSCNNIQ
jgi:hypothetical protein